MHTQRQGLGLEVRPRLADLLRNQLWDRCKQRASVDDRPNVRKARHRAAHAARLPKQIFNDAAQIAVIGHDDVLVRKVDRLC